MSVAQPFSGGLYTCTSGFMDDVIVRRPWPGISDAIATQWGVAWITRCGVYSN